MFPRGVLCFDHKTRSRQMAYAVRFLMLSFLLVSYGCATIVQGTSQKVPINTIPQEADVRIDGSIKVMTPATVELARKSDHTLFITKAGYYDESFTLRSQISEYLAGNCLLGGIIGMGVDAASGAAYKLVPEQVIVQLKPKVESAPSVPTPPPSPPATGPSPQVDPQGTGAAVEQSQDGVPEDNTRKLRSLKRLLDEGLISQEDYDAKKRDILDGMIR
jgi:hypothetical protein